MENNTQKVYSALSKARLKISQSDITKNGQTESFKTKNGKTMPARDYLALKDITPLIVEACAEFNLVTKFGMDLEWVSLEVISCEDGSTIEFKVPANMAGNEVDMGAGGGQMHPIQRLGSSMTYMRRYLNLVAFDIVENDNIEGSEQIEVDKSQEVAAMEQQKQQALEAEKQKMTQALKHFTAQTKQIAAARRMDPKAVTALLGVTKESTFDQVNKAISDADAMIALLPTEKAEEQATAAIEPNMGGFSEPNF